MMQSVVQKSSRKVKFWLLKNFLSPAFMGFLPQMAQAVGFEYALVQYQWPTWLHKQTNKQVHAELMQINSLCKTLPCN